MSDLIGKVVSDRYEILEMIGDGGMAHVYKGRDRILERMVAVKVLQPQYNSDEEFIRRFHREAQAATSLSHPHIVNIYDVGEEEDIYFIVMEYIEGETLKEKIQREGPLPLEETVRLMSQILDAIHHAHHYGIIHRDMKPHNILLTKEGNAKVTDFGIARATSAATITHTNSVIGSVHYLSPEQAKGGYVSERSDIYSIGVVLYEMVTGTLPYTGDSAVSIALKHLQETLPRPKEKRPDLPQSLENVILKATAKKQEDRYHSVLAMKMDLSTSLSPERSIEPMFVPAKEMEQTKTFQAVQDESKQKEEDVVETNKETFVGEGKPKKKRRRKLWIALFTFLFIFIAGILAFTLIPSFLQVADTEVPDTVGLTEEEAIDLLEEHELIAETERMYDDEIEKDVVISQRPQAGRTVKVESPVTLYVSDGQEEVEMPDVIGMSRNQVENMLQDFDHIKFSGEERADIPPGQIVEQEPQAGEMVVPNETTVYLTYSEQQQFAIQSLEGETRQTVENYLERTGLQGTFSERPSDTVPPGRVIEQRPAPYSMVTEGAEVHIVLSSGPEEEEKKTEQIEAVIPIEVGEQEQERGDTFSILILYDDATTDGEEVFVEETISETTTYRVPLVVTPDQDGGYTLYVNDEEVQSNRFSYGEQ